MTGGNVVTVDVPRLVTTLLILSIVALGVAAIVSWLYVKKVYDERGSESRELRRLVMRDKRIATAGGFLAVVVVGLLIHSLNSDMPVLPSPWTTIVAAISIDVLLWGVTADALAFRRYRKQGLVVEDQDDERPKSDP